MACEAQVANYRLTQDWLAGVADIELPNSGCLRTSRHAALFMIPRSRLTEMERSECPATSVVLQDQKK